MPVSRQTPVAHDPLTAPERRLLCLLALGQTPAQAAPALGLAPAEAEAMLAAMLSRHGFSAPRPLLTRALIHRWL